MSNLQQKIIGLYNILGGTHDLAFLHMAFDGYEKGEVAIAVVELACDGKLVLGEGGIQLRKERDIAGSDDSVKEAASSASMPSTPAAVSVASASEACLEVSEPATPSAPSEATTEPAANICLEPDEPVAPLSAESNVEPNDKERLSDLVGVEEEPVYNAQDYLPENEIQALIDRIPDTSSGAFDRSVSIAQPMLDLDPREPSGPFDGSEHADSSGPASLANSSGKATCELDDCPSDHDAGAMVNGVPVLSAEGKANGDVGEKLPKSSSGCVLRAEDLCSELPFSNREKEYLFERGINTVLDLVKRFNSLRVAGAEEGEIVSHIERYLGSSAVPAMNLPKDEWCALQSRFECSFFAFDSLGYLIVIPEAARLTDPTTFSVSKFLNSFIPHTDEVVRDARGRLKASGYRPMKGSFRILQSRRAETLLRENHGSVKEAAKMLAAEIQEQQQSRNASEGLSECEAQNQEQVDQSQQEEPQIQQECTSDPQEQSSQDEALTTNVYSQEGTDGAPTSEYAPFVYAYDRISALRLPKNCELKLLDRGFATIRELVHGLSSIDREEPGKADLRRTVEEALGSVAKLPGYGVSEQQLHALVELSGSDLFVFDIYGRIVDVSQLCEREGITFCRRKADNVSLCSLEVLGLPKQKVRRLSRLGLRTVGDIERVGERALIDSFGMLPQAAAVAFDRIERLRKGNGVDVGSSNRQADSFQSGVEPTYSSAVMSVLRSVQCEFERLEYPLESGELQIILLPMISDAYKRPNTSHAQVFKYVVQRISNLDETYDTLLELIWRRVRAAIATLPREASQASVTVPSGSAWGIVAVLAKIRYQGTTDVVSHPDKRTTELLFQVETLDQWISEIPENLRPLVEMRLNGSKYKECAESVGLDKDAMQRLMLRIMASRPFILEERFLSIFDTYDIDADQFFLETGQPKRVYRFLKEISNAPKTGKLPYRPSPASGEVGEPALLQVAASSDSGVLEGGESVVLKRSQLIDYLFRSIAFDQSASLGELYDEYRALLTRHGLQDSERLQFGSMHKFASFIKDKGSFLVSRYDDGLPGNRLRFYDADAYDFAPLSKLLAEWVDKNVELSVAKLFNDESVFNACEQIDVRNESELFSLIEQGFCIASGLVVGDFPLVQFGKADRDAQVKNIILDFGPASARSLAREYEHMYGVSEVMFVGEFLAPFERYRQGGQYLIAEEPPNAAQLGFLNDELRNADECCSFSLVRDRFKVKFPDFNLKLAQDELLDRVGWRVSEKLLFKEGVDEHEYFARLIDSRSRFSEDEPGFGPEVFSHSAFRSELDKRKRSFQVVEISHRQYRSTKPFAKLDCPIRPWMMRDYVNKAIQFIPKETPFTVKSLRDAGFTHQLDSIEDELGFGQSFFEAVLSEGYLNGGLKKTRLGDSVVFCRIEGSFTGALFVSKVVEELKAIEIEDLAGHLADRYGIAVDSNRLRALAKQAGDGDCYYNARLEMLFDSYETFGREAEKWLY